MIASESKSNFTSLPGKFDNHKPFQHLHATLFGKVNGKYTVAGGDTFFISVLKWEAF